MFKVVLCAALTLTPSIAMSQQKLIDTPEGYKRIVKDVSDFALLGVWYETCLGDPENKEYGNRASLVGSAVKLIAGRDQVRFEAVTNAGLADARKRFPQFDCVRDAEAIKTTAQSAFEDIRLALKPSN